MNPAPEDATEPPATPSGTSIPPTAEAAGAAEAAGSGAAGRQRRNQGADRPILELKAGEARPSERPARGSEPAAVLLAMQLLKWLMPITGRFPKNYRYGLGSRIEAAHLDVLEELVHAQYSRGEARASALERANTRLQSARLLMRLAAELKVMSEGAVLHAAKQQVELGQQVGAWRKTSASMVNSSRNSVIPVT